MIKGLYTSASGMLPHIKKQELSANNLANASTSGYKKDRVFTRELTKAETRLASTPTEWAQPMTDHIYTDFKSGAFNRTDNPLDFAIEGDGFFALQTPDGQTLLTRSGSFTISPEGLLTFPGGAEVMGEGGAIEIGNGRVEVSYAGDVQVDGFVVGRLVPVTVADLTELEKVGGSMFAVPPGQELVPLEDFTIRQGYIEASNVDIVSEMVDMIASYRAYEANAKAVQSQDSSLEHLFNRVASRGQ